jgi:uncharacterized membrane protein SpoIIM required for sporulation
VSWSTWLGHLTGLALISPGLSGETLLRTVLVVQTCDSLMCRLIAHNNGYSKTLWTCLGFVLGIWAMAVLILLPRRAPPPAASRSASQASATT